jgi:hypothetical protein
MKTKRNFYTLLGSKNKLTIFINLLVFFMLNPEFGLKKHQKIVMANEVLNPPHPPLASLAAPSPTKGGEGMQPS